MTNRKPKPKSAPVLRVLRAIMIEPYIRASDAHHLYRKLTSWPDFRPDMREEYWHASATDTDAKSDLEIAQEKIFESRPAYKAADIDDYLPAMKLARLIYSNAHYREHWRALVWHGRGASYAAIGKRLGCSHTAARGKILKAYELIELAALRDSADEIIHKEKEVSI